MNIEKIKEIIKKSKEAAPNHEAFLLAEAFEEFMVLHEARSEIKNPKDWLVYAGRIQASREQIAAQLERTAASLGLTSEQMRAYFDAPANFSESQWTEMQELRKEALSERKGAAPLLRKKLRNNNIRI